MDKDGYVTAEELIKVVEKVGGCMSQDEARGLIRKVKKTISLLFQFHEKNYSFFSFFHSYIRFGKRALQHPHTKKDQNSEEEDVLNSLNFLQV